MRFEKKSFSVRFAPAVQFTVLQRNAPEIVDDRLQPLSTTLLLHFMKDEQSSIGNVEAS